MKEDDNEFVTIIFDCTANKCEASCTEKFKEESFNFIKQTWKEYGSYEKIENIITYVEDESSTISDKSFAKASWAWYMLLEYFRVYQYADDYIAYVEKYNKKFEKKHDKYKFYRYYTIMSLYYQILAERGDTNKFNLALENAEEAINHNRPLKKSFLPILNAIKSYS